jgi:tetratricopeptide (TPR) repeat protein
VTFLWWFAPLALGTRGHSLLLWILTFGSVRLFAGYIETYTLAFAFSCCWTLSAWGYLNRRVRSIWMFAFWALALLSHVTAVLLLPASLWVLSRTDDGRVSLKGRELLGFALVALAIGGVVVFAFFRTQVERVGAGTGHFLMSITSEPPHRYGLFSSAHLADFINHWLLLAPAFVVVGLALAIQSARSKLFNIRDYLSHDLLFWTLAAFAPIAAGFIIDPKLGWARDWDLFTLLSAPALTGIAIWLTRLTGPLKRAALSIAFLSAGLWLTFSVDGNAERRRFEALLDLDQSRSDYGHEILAQYYQRIGDSEGTLRHYRAALLVSENIRYRVNIAVAYFDMRKYDEAEVWGRGVIARDPNNASAHHGLSLVLTATERPMEALDHSARAVTLDPRQPDYAMQYALVLVELERYAEALPLLRRVAQSSPREAAPLNVLSVCYLALDSAAAAKAYALAALRVAPEEAMIWLNAASAAFREHSWHESARYLLEYKKRVPDSALHPEAQAMLDSLSQLPEPL